MYLPPILQVMSTAAISISHFFVSPSQCSGPAATIPLPKLGTGPVPDLDSVIPIPVSVTRAAGKVFELTPKTFIHIQHDSHAVRDLGSLLAEELRPVTGFPLPVLSSPAPHQPRIGLALGATDGRLGDEGYILTVGTKAVLIQAKTPAGLFAGTRTLLQLLPRDIDSPRRVRRQWTISGGKIIDYPRFAYRGAMLDVARHFHPIPNIERYIREIARFKINHLHLHLTDDQGWRIELARWPLLAEVGGAPGTGVGNLGGGYITRHQFWHLVAYARRWGVTIVPEIDMPGHVNAAQVAYPALYCGDPEKQPTQANGTDVGYSALCLTSNTTKLFVADAIRELAAMTPGPYLHIGGDESFKVNMADYVDFIDSVLPLVHKAGKIPIGWHEIVNSNASRDAVVQFWGINAEPKVGDAAKNGTKLLLSPAHRTYLDMAYDMSSKLGLSWAGYIPVKKAYDWEPLELFDNITDKNVLGVEAPLWSETLKSMADIEYMAFPRLPAIAEIAWSQKERRGWDGPRGFATRLGRYGARWALRSVGFYPSEEVDWAVDG